jgi:hypothetical protein
MFSVAADRFAALAGCFFSAQAPAATATAAAAACASRSSVVSAGEFTLAISVSVTSALVSSWHISINLLDFVVVS